jgi:hypothetical protein
MENLNKYKEIIDIFMKENKFLFKENTREIAFMSSSKKYHIERVLVF